MVFSLGQTIMDDNQKNIKKIIMKYSSYEFFRNYNDSDLNYYQGDPNGDISIAD
jgi:hypothetical protein